MEKTRKKLPPTTYPDKLIISFFFFVHVCLFGYTNYRGCNDDRVLSSASSAKFSRGERFFDARRPDGLRHSLLWLFIVLFSPLLSLSLSFFVYVKERAVIGTCFYALWVKSPGQRVRGTYGSCAFLGAIVS